jgi:hypothetical protein
MWPFQKENDSPPARKTPHHYILTHVALRQVAFGNPYRFFAVMASPQRQDFLDDLWRQVCQDCDKGGTASFTSSDIKVHPILLGDYPTVLVEMPKPEFTGEAHMVCVVIKVPVQLAAEPDNPEVLYFTLEKGRTVTTGKDITFLCGWDGESHVNYGYGPEADPAAFLERVRDLI